MHTVENLTPVTELTGLNLVAANSLRARSGRIETEADRIRYIETLKRQWNSPLDVAGIMASVNQNTTLEIWRTAQKVDQVLAQ